MKLNWQVRTLKEWRQIFSQAKTHNWMQSWAYAQASFKIDRLYTKIALIEKNKTPIGAMSVQQIKLGPIQIINLKRGPLWFVEPDENLLLEFAEAFRNEFPKTLFQRLRWLPEFEMTQNLVNAIEKIGFSLKKENFITSWIDLTEDLNAINKTLDQKWRNGLNKALKAELTVIVDRDNKNLLSFLNYYDQHLSTKKYRGPTSKFLKEEFIESEMTRDHFFIWALHNGQPISGIAINKFGKSAAYRVGWNTPKGRAKNAHYLLIWKALEICKNEHILQFDLGGMLPDEAQGVTKFKSGLNGKVTQFKIFGN
jgi:hypothetical protein